MKLQRIVQQMESLLSAKHRKRRKQIEELKDLLKKLKKKDRKLKRDIEMLGRGDTARLQDKLKVVRAQRRKGVAALKVLLRSG